MGDILPHATLEQIFFLCIRGVKGRQYAKKNGKPVIVRYSCVYPLPLVCKDWYKFALRAITERYLQLSPSLEKMPPGMVFGNLNLIRDINTFFYAKPRLWIQLRPERFYNGEPAYTCKIKWLKWKFIACQNAYERKFVYTIADDLNLYKTKVQMQKIYFRQKQQNQQSWCHDETCSSCYCKAFKTVTIGVLISEAFVKTYADGIAHRFLKKVENNLEQYLL